MDLLHAQVCTLLETCSCRWFDLYCLPDPAHLVIGIGSFLQSVSLLVNAVLLGLLAGLFEESARYILFKFILKDTDHGRKAFLLAWDTAEWKRSSWGFLQR
jgi:hypothetical protein